MTRRAGGRQPPDNSQLLCIIQCFTGTVSREGAGFRSSFPSSRDSGIQTVILSNSCRMTNDWLCGVGERTAPSTGHHTSPEFVREITSPALVVSAPRHSGCFGPKSRSVRQWNYHSPLGRGRPAPASKAARLNGAVSFGSSNAVAIFLSRQPTDVGSAALARHSKGRRCVGPMQ